MVELASITVIYTVWQTQKGDSNLLVRGYKCSCCLDLLSGFSFLDWLSRFGFLGCFYPAKGYQTRPSTNASLSMPLGASLVDVSS